VLKSLANRLTTVASRALRRVSPPLHAASRPAAPVFGFVTDLLRPRRLLLAESVLPRQQLLVLGRQIKRPSLTAFDRAVIVSASAITGTWRESALLLARMRTRGYSVKFTGENRA